MDQEAQTHNASVCVLVSSFDEYSDCWPIFEHSMRKYWPDCPFEVYLIVNEKEPDFEFLQPLKVGQDKGWGANLIKALHMVDESIVLYLQEDYWLTKMVHTERIHQMLQLIWRENAYYIRLCASPPADLNFLGDHRLGVIATNARYRASLQASLWRKDVLEDLIHPNDTPWDFERHGSVRSNEYGDRFLAIMDPKDDVLHYVHRTAIVQGRWTTSARDYIKTEGLEGNLSTRQSENWWDDVKRQHPRLRRLMNVVRRRIRSLTKVIARIGGSP